jgi:hypothetical protein
MGRGGLFSLSSSLSMMASKPPRLPKYSTLIR